MSTSPDLVGDNATNRQAQPENCATIESSCKHRKEYMPNYEVGDTVEELRPDGTVEDTGVVTKIEEYGGFSPVVYRVWATWENDLGEFYFLSHHELFRIKVKRKVEPEITLETVSKVLEQYFDSNPAALDKTIGKHVLITRVFYALQAKYEVDQKKNDPEYQKYLELKKKFDPE